METTYRFSKDQDTFYVDYVIKDNKCFIIQELRDGRVRTTFVCDTDKNSCDELEETETEIIITI